MIAYIKLATGEYPRHEGDIRAEHPEILESQTYPNFPCPPTYAPVVWAEPPAFDRIRERPRLGAPVQRDGEWHTVWVIEPIPVEVLAPRVREERNKRLAESDWTQLADAPLTAEKKAEWTQYRHQLRDITQQPEFPWAVVWPNKPE